MKHKFKSRWFRVAVEGSTTDGRNIERSWIEDMAAQYDTNTYTARINCEHIKWPWPGGDFGAYGSVLAAKAEEVEINGETKLALFVQIEPNEALLKLNKAGQKLHTSIEVQPNFADTGKAYLVGMALTDSPASLGTEALQFSAQHGTLTNRKQHADNLFTAAEAVSIEFDEQPAEDKTAGLFSRVQSILGLVKKNAASNDQSITELTQAVEALADHSKGQADQVAALSENQTGTAEQLTKLQTEHAELLASFNALKDQLEQQPSFSQTQRPAATGGDATLKTQF